MKIESKKLAYIAGIGSSSIFGLSFLFTKTALDYASPMTLISYRFITAFLVMSILIGLKVIKVNYKGKPIKSIAIVALSQPILYFIFETYGIEMTSSSYAGLMISLIPILVTILGIYILNEKTNKYQTAFILLSVFGVIFITLMDSSSSPYGGILGTLLLFGAVISAAVFNIASRKSSQHFTAIEITYFMMGTAAIFFTIVSVGQSLMAGTISEYFVPLSHPQFIAALLYLGILSSVIAFLLVNYQLSHLPASVASLFSNISTVVSISAGVIFLNEIFLWYHLVGSVMILTGIWGAAKFNPANLKSNKENEDTTLEASEESTAV